MFSAKQHQQDLKIKRGTAVCDNHGYWFLLLKVSSQLNVNYQKKAQLFFSTSPQSPDNIQKRQTRTL